MDDDQNMMDEEVDKSLHIKGQMNFMPDWNVVMFLCSPAIDSVSQSVSYLQGQVMISFGSDENIRMISLLPGS